MSITITGSGPSLLRTFTFPDANATVLTSANVVTPAQGGTGLASFTIGDLLYASGATVLASLADVAVGSLLASGGVGVAPAWSANPTLTSLTLTAGSGSQTGKAPIGIFVSTTPTSNVGTTETDLLSYTMPANTLNTNGQRVRITAFCTTAANANLKTIKVYFGATALRNTGAAAFNNDVAEITATVIRTGASSQVAMSRIQTSSSWYVGPASPAETLANAITIKVTGTSNTGSSDVTNTLLFVEWLPA